MSFGVGINLWNAGVLGGDAGSALGVGTDLQRILALSPSLLVWPALATMTQATDGTGAAPSSGDPVGRILDLSGNGNNLIAGAWASPSNAARGTYTESGGKSWITADGINDWYSTLGPLNLGETWWHVGMWRADADSRAFATSSDERGSLRFNTTLSQVQWQNSAGSWTSIAAGTLTNPFMVTVQQASTTSLTGRINGAAGSTITPFDDSGATQGLALFSRQNSSWLAGLNGRFYGGLWGTGVLSDADRAIAESIVSTFA